jgi:hypothetical protein
VFCGVVWAGVVWLGVVAPPVLCGVVVVGVALVPPVEGELPAAVPPVAVVDVVEVVDDVVFVLDVPEPLLRAFALGGAVSWGVVFGIVSATLLPPPHAERPRPPARASMVKAAGRARRIEPA